jgi:hypothetical protein
VGGGRKRGAGGGGQEEEGITRKRGRGGESEGRNNLALGDLLLVECHTEDSGEGRLSGLDDLAKGHSAGREGKDGEGVGGSSAEGNGDHGDDVLLGNGGELAGVGGGPQEEGIDAADTELKSGDGEGEPGRAAGGLEGELVGDVVVVVAEVPVVDVARGEGSSPSSKIWTGVDGSWADKHENTQTR